MISFKNDYSEGCIPEIMALMNQSNLIQSIGYGEDKYCQKARVLIQKKLGNDTCDIHFVVGGTQANLIVISSMLRPYEALIAVNSGHVNVHETGAIEATGHKVVTVEGVDGKICVEDIKRACLYHEDEHMVKPAMVYISNATEIGTIYSKQELQDIRNVCNELGLYLFMDGARLGSALASVENDLEFYDLCTYCDVFYIGGTKNGALFGEAIVIVNDTLKKDFRYMIKQRGGMLAKGRLLGIQFVGLFDTDCYVAISKHANELAMRLQDAFESCGYSLFIKTSTNQIFPILPNDVIQMLAENFQFQNWEVVNESNTAMRFVTSWATKEEDVDAFIQVLESSTCHKKYGIQ